MVGAVYGPHGFYLKILLALYFLWAVFLKVLCHQEENDEVGKGQENGDSLGQAAVYEPEYQEKGIKQRQPFGLDGKYKVNIKVFLREHHRVSQEYGHTQVRGVKVHIPSPDKVYNKLGKYDADGSHKKEHVKAERSPHRLQGTAQ